MKSHGKFNEIGSVTVSGSRTYKKAKEVKNTRLNTGIAFWVGYVIVLFILLLAALGLVAQTVQL